VTTPNSWMSRALQACALVLFAATGSGCGQPTDDAQGKEVNARSSALSTYHTTNGTGAIVLRDRLGNAIPVGATTPYSPEKTCGGCHDTSVITQGYHFQQGKGSSNSSIYVADDFNPTKPWLLSDGMYGKW
jgi:hypothetical protein